MFNICGLKYRNLPQFFSTYKETDNTGGFSTWQPAKNYTQAAKTKSISDGGKGKRILIKFRSFPH